MPTPSLAPTVMSKEQITYYKCWPGKYCDTTNCKQDVYRVCTELELSVFWLIGRVGLMQQGV
jgi:hypothetical protein